MTLPAGIRQRLSIPAVCAPMFLVSTPALVSQACANGIIGGIPRHNARSLEQFEAWLGEIQDALRREREMNAAACIGPLAVNLSSRLTPDEMEENLRLCEQYGVEIVINAIGNPQELTRRAHEHGLLVYADAINLRFAEKAISVGVDGITAIGAGGGGHSGTISHFALVAAIRQRFDGTLIMAGALSNGAAIRAAEVLGADLAYLGTRFIATQESGAAEEYKRMLVSETSAGLRYTAAVTGVPANWLEASLRAAGIEAEQHGAGAPLPEGAKPWVNVWSAGQGIDLIDDVPTVRALVARLREEYRAACNVPAFNA